MGKRGAEEQIHLSTVFLPASTCATKFGMSQGLSYLNANLMEKREHSFPEYVSFFACYNGPAVSPARTEEW